MDKTKIGPFILASAVVWGAVIIGCAFRLKGTQYYHAISPILIGGAIFHILFIWGSLAGLFRKKDKNRREA